MFRPCRGVLCGIALSCGLLGIVGCGADKSPDLTPEQLNSQGAQKSSAVQDAINKSKAGGPPAPGAKAP